MLSSPTLQNYRLGNGAVSHLLKLNELTALNLSQSRVTSQAVVALGCLATLQASTCLRVLIVVALCANCPRAAAGLAVVALGSCLGCRQVLQAALRAYCASCIACVAPGLPAGAVCETSCCCCYGAGIIPVALYCN